MNYEILSVDRLDEHEKLIRENGYLRTERNKLKDKINKAIEYIEREEVSSIGTPYSFTERGKDLLKILRGEDNE